MHYGEPSFEVGGDGRIVQVDKHGNKQPHKAQYVIKNDRVYESDAYGRVRYDRHSYAVGKDGCVVQTDAYGNKRHDKPQFKVVDGKVYEADAYGRVQQQKFIIKNEQRRSN